MVQAVVLAFILGAILLCILLKGFRYSWAEPYAQGYHLWALRDDENEPCYLGCWNDSYVATEVAEESLQDKKTIRVMVRKPGGSRRDFTAQDLQSQEGIFLI